MKLILSTGGQSSNSKTTRLEQIAFNCGYKKIYKPVDLSSLVKILDDVKESNLLTMILIKTSKIISNVGRADKSIDLIMREFKECLLNKK